MIKGRQHCLVWTYDVIYIVVMLFTLYVGKSKYPQHSMFDILFNNKPPPVTFDHGCRLVNLAAFSAGAALLVA